jgi:CcmD family protein
MKKLFAFLVLFVLSISAWAQGGAGSMQANWDESLINTLKQDGRIYIVIVVIAIIVIGLFAYMWRLDRKITRLEKEIRQ